MLSYCKTDGILKLLQCALFVCWNNINKVIGPLKIVLSFENYGTSSYCTDSRTTK